MQASLQDGNTVLHLAAWRGHAMLVQFLLAVSDNINIVVNKVFVRMSLAGRARS